MSRSGWTTRRNEGLSQMHERHREMARVTAPDDNRSDFYQVMSSVCEYWTPQSEGTYLIRAVVFTEQN
jgi:hypothetical protein